MAHRIHVTPRGNVALPVLARLVVATALAVSLSATLVDAAAPLQLKGTVYDADTKQPLDGAYVIASYLIARVGPPGVAIWCVKTRGMYTAADGRFFFPVEKLDGRSPSTVSAIKPGYFLDHATRPKSEVWQRQDEAAYSEHDIFLRRQDDKKPDFHFGMGDEDCDHPETADDAAAAVQFLRIERDQYVKYRTNQKAIEALGRRIEAFERLSRKQPEQGGAK
jgi:hypothetical protein